MYSDYQIDVIMEREDSEKVISTDPVVDPLPQTNKQTKIISVSNDETMAQRIYLPRLTTGTTFTPKRCLYDIFVNFLKRWMRRVF